MYKKRRRRNFKKSFKRRRSLKRSSRRKRLGYPSLKLGGYWQ